MQKLDMASRLQQRLTDMLTTVEREFAALTDDQLSRKPAPDQWSIIECLQHLNLAGRIYIRNIQHKVDTMGPVQNPPVDQTVEGDLVGKAMLWAVDPQANIKLPSPGIIRPRSNTELTPAVVMSQFLDLYTLLRSLLDKAVYLDWNREKVVTLFGNWLKIRLGDTFLMLVAHAERHLNQALRVKADVLNQPI